MALTSTEENQLRELLRRVSDAQNGVTADNLSIATRSQAQYALVNGGKSVYRAAFSTVADLLSGAAVSSSASNSTSPNASYNHLITRDAARFEITRMTYTSIQTAQNTANTASSNASTALAKATSNETWRNQASPLIQRSFKVFGHVYSGNPAIQAGSMNPVTMGDAAKTHRFGTPMSIYTAVMFAIGGDQNYPRFDLIIEGGKAVGFRTIHMPPPGIWVAIGEAV